MDKLILFCFLLLFLCFAFVLFLFLKCRTHSFAMTSIKITYYSLYLKMRHLYILHLLWLPKTFVQNDCYWYFTLWVIRICFSIRCLMWHDTYKYNKDWCVWNIFWCLNYSRTFLFYSYLIIIALVRYNWHAITCI